MGDKQWTYKLFDCCARPPQIYCFICCPCYASCTITLATFAFIPTETAGERCCLACLFPCICFPINRGKVRRHFKIKGNFCVDFLLHCFCHCCALIQENREATKEISQEMNQVAKEMNKAVGELAKEMEEQQKLEQQKKEAAVAQSQQMAQV